MNRKGQEEKLLGADTIFFYSGSQLYVTVPMGKIHLLASMKDVLFLLIRLQLKSYILFHIYFLVCVCVCVYFNVKLKENKTN